MGGYNGKKKQKIACRAKQLTQSRKTIQTVLKN